MPYKDPEKQRAWREAHREEQNAYRRKWSKDNADRVARYARNRRARSPEKLAAYNRAWREANPDRVCAGTLRHKARKRKAHTAPYERSMVYAEYSGRCVYCWQPATHLDHVVPLVRGGADAPENVVPACARCNQTKNAQPLLVWLSRRSP